MTAAKKKRLCRLGLVLLPWLPAFLMAIAVTHFFSPPQYYARVVMDVNRSAQPINFERAPVSLVHWDLSPIGYFGVATAVAFITGLALITIALFARSNDSDNHTKRA